MRESEPVLENSSTRRRTVSTAPAIVSAQERMTSKRRFVGRRSPLQMTLNPLRRKRDRRKRILDFMRHAARHLAPCGLFLSFQQIGKIFEHYHISGRSLLMAQESPP